MGLLQLGEFHSDDSVSHLLGLHELVSLEIGEFCSDGSLSDLLGPLSLLEVFGDLGGVESSLDSLGALSNTNLDNKLGKVEILQVSDSAGNSRRWSIDLDSISIDDVDNSGELALVVSGGDEDDAPNLNDTVEDHVYQTHRYRS